MEAVVSWKRTVIFVILVLSVLLGLRLSGVFETESVRRPVRTNEAEEILDKAIQDTKTVFNFSVNDLSGANTLYDEIIDREEITSLYYMRARGGIVSVIEVPRNLYGQIIGQIRALPGLENEKTESSSVPVISLEDINKHVEHNSTLLRRYMNRLDNQYLTTREITELRNEIRNVQAKIDSLNTLKREKDRDSSLIMTVINERFASPPTKVSTQYVRIAMNIVLSFVIILILSIALFFSVKLIVKIMTLLGIRTPRGRSIYHRYASRSGRYGSETSKIRKRKP